MKQFWSIFKRIAIILPISLLFLLMYNQLIELERNNARAQLIAEQRGRIHLLEYMVDQAFLDYEATLHLIRNSNEFEEYLVHPDTSSADVVLQLFDRIGSNRSYVVRVLLQDQHGNPLLEFSPTKRGLSEQIHYQRISASDHDIFVATESANSHNAVIVLQNVDGLENSMLTVALPIYAGGIFSGVLSLAVEGDHITSLFDRFLVDNLPLLGFFVMDRSGRIVHLEGNASLPEMLQAQVFQPEGPNFPIETFETHVVMHPEGHHTVGDITYYHQQFNTLEVSGDSGSGHDLGWVVVVAFKNSDIAVLQDSFVLRNEPVKWILAVFILVMGSMVNLLAYFRKNDKELLLVSNLISENSQDGVVIADPNLSVTYCNKTFEAFSGLPRETVMAGRYDLISLDGESLYNTLQASRGLYGSWRGMLWFNSGFHCALTHVLVHAITNSQGKLLYHVGMFSSPGNISREPFETIMRSGKANADRYDTYPVLLGQAYINTGASFRLCYLKISNMEEVEKNFSADDLYRFSEKFRTILRRFQGPDDFLAQYSPDTYVFSIPHWSVPDIAPRMEELLASCMEPFDFGGNKRSAHPVAGLSRSSRDVRDAAQLLLESRMALATLDHLQRQGFLVYDESVNEQITRYYEILSEFPRAIQSGSVKVMFQPVVEISSRHIIGAEALARWIHPVLGPVSPSEFLPIIEQNGLERMLGRYVVERVVEFLSYVHPDPSVVFSVSMNLCPVELQDKALVPSLVRALDEQGIDHKRLVIELTERTLLTDLQAANSVLAALHAQGIAVAIDDFGTGFSSLSYLKHLDVDTLKIDRSFLQDYPDKDDGSILKAIVGMARQLDIHTVAEGVETEEQLDLLRSVGCAGCQGFFFSPAVDSVRFAAMLSQ